MFGRKKIRKLEETVSELKLSFGYLKDMLEAAQDVIKQNQRQGAEQAKAFDEKLSRLEETVKQVGEERNVEGAVPYEKKNGSKELSSEQIMDEWLNGKKAGDR